MALDGDALYVADTENHLIRRVNLKTRVVETVAGTGQQSNEYFKQGPAKTIGLNSPWDLQLIGRALYIAMAGPHQIWKLDLDNNTISTFAGSGREARLDGPLLEAGFAQPSGMASNSKTLYVSDAEANIIRAIDVRSGQVKTLVAAISSIRRRRWERNDVRLQHPLRLLAFGDNTDCGYIQSQNRSGLKSKVQTLVAQESQDRQMELRHPFTNRAG